MNINPSTIEMQALARLLGDIELDKDDPDYDLVRSFHKKLSKAIVQRHIRRNSGKASEKLLELQEAGFTIREISDLTDIPYSTIYGRLKKSGVELARIGGTKSRLDHSEFEKTTFLYVKMGMSTNEIAEQLGLVHDTVCYRLDQAGVRRRSRGESIRLRYARRPKARAA